MDVEPPTVTQDAFKRKIAFFQKNQLGIGQSWRKLEEIGQKLDFREVCSEIQANIEVYSSFGLFLASAPIA